MSFDVLPLIIIYIGGYFYVRHDRLVEVPFMGDQLVFNGHKDWQKYCYYGYWPALKIDKMITDVEVTYLEFNNPFED